LFSFLSIFVDLCHFGTDPYLRLTDPDSVLIRTRNRILHLSSVADKMPTKKFKMFCLLLFDGTFISLFKDKSRRSLKIVEIKFIIYFFRLLIERAGQNDGLATLPSERYKKQQVYKNFNNKWRHLNISTAQDRS
jgi:hypothetical protein